MGTTFLPSPVPPKTSQELTINTSLWTANRNRIHTMHIFINSCPFYKLFAYMNHFIGHSSLDSWWSPLHYCPLVLAPRLRPNIIAQEGPIAQGCVSWLWYKRDQLLVAIVECGGRAKSGLNLPITKVEAGETEIIAMMRMFTENYSRQALIPFSPSKHQQSRQSKQAQFLFSVILWFVLY